MIRKLVGQKMTKLANGGMKIEFSKESKAYRQCGLMEYVEDESSIRGHKYTFSLSPDDSEKMVISCTRKSAQQLFNIFKETSKETALAFIKNMTELTSRIGIDDYSVKLIRPLKVKPHNQGVEEMKPFQRCIQLLQGKLF